MRCQIRYKVETELQKACNEQYWQTIIPLQDIYRYIHTNAYYLCLNMIGTVIIITKNNTELYAFTTCSE